MAMAKSVRQLLERLAVDTWFRIRDGHDLKISQGEVAITEYLLLEIKRQNLPGIEVKKTSIVEEKNMGADWEWWVGCGGFGWLRYAVQAKKLNRKTDSYAKLGYRAKDGVRQVDTLVDYARKSKALAIYCLFNSRSGQFHRCYKPYWHCGLKPSTVDPMQLGCSIASAEAIRSAPDGKKGTRKFCRIHRDGALPWRCLVCPQMMKALKESKKNSKDGGERKLLTPFSRDPTLVHSQLPSWLGAEAHAGGVDSPLAPETTPIARYALTIDIDGCRDIADEHAECKADKWQSYEIPNEGCI